MILYIDTATTTGEWQWKLPETDATQPHMIRVAAILANTGVHDEFCRVVARQPNWPAITPQGTDRHGIDESDMAGLGVQLGAVLTRVSAALARADLIVAHNADYHMRVLRRAFRDDGREVPAPLPLFCTMRRSADIVQVRLQGNGRWKWPTLGEAFGHFAGEALSLSADPIARGQQMVEAVRVIHQGIVALTPGTAA